ncbi:MAG: hypothetical protein AB1467_02000 [Candidatus Diapherotrites archaeon]
MQEQQKPKEEVWRDFHLLALSHLNAHELFNSDGSVKEKARKEIKRRLNYGKKFILQNTKEGDLIAFEGPEKVTFDSYKKECLPYYQEKFKENAVRMLTKNWRILRLNWNFYTELAHYAKVNGRKIISLESALHKPGSKLSQVYGLKNIEKYARVKYLVEYSRDLSFIRKIQKIKPKMVVVARSHGVLIEVEMRPKVEYFPEMNLMTKMFSYMQAKKLHNNYLKEKRERRTRINEELKRKKEVRKIISQIAALKARKRI